jgi:hypothetical protein
VNPSRSRILLSRDLGAVAHETSLGYYQRCVFCNEIIEQGDARAAILMFDSRIEADPDEPSESELLPTEDCRHQACELVDRVRAAQALVRTPYRIGVRYPATTNGGGTEDAS